MKIPDIAWPTFFDSYRESMLKIKIVMITFRCSSMDDVKASMFHVSDICMQCKVH